MSRVESSRDRLLRDLVRGELAISYVQRYRPHHVSDLHPPAVGDGDIEVEVVEPGSTLLQLLQNQLHARGQELYLANCFDPDPIAVYPLVLEEPIKPFCEYPENFSDFR